MRRLRQPSSAQLPQLGRHRIRKVRTVRENPRAHERLLQPVKVGARIRRRRIRGSEHEQAQANKAIVRLRTKLGHNRLPIRAAISSPNRRELDRKRPQLLEHRSACVSLQ